MSEESVTIVYHGPHASGYLTSRYDDESYPFEKGKPFTVPAWVANGHPGEPGTYDAGDGPKSFTKPSEVPPGAVILEEHIAAEHGVLKDQPDNYKLATKSKKPTAPDTEEIK